MKTSALLILSSVLGLGAAVGYSVATRVEQPRNSEPITAAAPAADTATHSTNHVAANAADASSEAKPAISVEQLIADARSQDQQRRSEAIIALANQPKEQAFPALQRAVDVSSSEGDRQLALRSLHTLAIEQGDDDGRIRDAVRTAIYHSDDEGVSQSAQAFLEDLDVVLGPPAP